MTDALSPRLKKKFAAYKRRVRDPQEAQPAGISVWKLPPYSPEKVQPARPGADDHQRIFSRGVST